MLPSAEEVEEEYVKKVYSRLAAYVAAPKPGSVNQRLCPAVLKFIKMLPRHAVVVDIGCGENKYELPGGLLLGVDPCSEILVKMPRTERCDVALADAIALPFRESTADAVFLISVLHHVASPARRKAVLAEMARVMAPGAQALVVVWAFEQPYAKFPTQDVLVPWNLHEIPINGRLPKIRFHKDSTKEQRIIHASIPISIAPEERNSPSTWINWIVSKVKTAPSLPSPTPHFLPPKKKAALFSGIRRWSPLLPRRLASLIRPVEEEFAEEVAEEIVRDAVNEAMATIREVTFYRYYHVFRKGEVESLVASIPSIRVVSSNFENGNWNVTVQKMSDERRPI